MASARQRFGQFNDPLSCGAYGHQPPSQARTRTSKCTKSLSKAETPHDGISEQRRTTHVESLRPLVAGPVIRENVAPASASQVQEASVESIKMQKANGLSGDSCAQSLPHRLPRLRPNFPPPLITDVATKTPPRRPSLRRRSASSRGIMSSSRRLEGERAMGTRHHGARVRTAEREGEESARSQPPKRRRGDAE
jgi:hypothetical protein